MTCNTPTPLSCHILRRPISLHCALAYRWALPYELQSHLHHWSQHGHVQGGVRAAGSGTVLRALVILRVLCSGLLWFSEWWGCWFLWFSGYCAQGSC